MIPFFYTAFTISSEAFWYLSTTQNLHPMIARKQKRPQILPRIQLPAAERRQIQSYALQNKRSSYKKNLAKKNVNGLALIELSFATLEHHTNSMLRLPKCRLSIAQNRVAFARAVTYNWMPVTARNTTNTRIFTKEWFDFCVSSKCHAKKFTLHPPWRDTPFWVS